MKTIGIIIMVSFNNLYFKIVVISLVTIVVRRLQEQHEINPAYFSIINVGI